MTPKTYKEILDAVAGDHFPAHTNLLPRITARLERKSLAMKLRIHPIVTTLIVLGILLTVSGVVYAVGRSLGYYPGLGIVDRDMSFYVLAEPVTETRDGITVSVEKVVSNADSILIVFEVAGIPPDSQSLLILPDSKICKSHPELHFPDGTSVQAFGGASRPLEDGYEGQYKFAPVPTDATTASLFIPCIWGGLVPGVLPENWELPMHLIPAPSGADLNIVPIVEDTPVADQHPPVETALLPDSPPQPQANSVDTNRLSILQVIDTGDNYILVGAFAPPAIPASEKGLYAILDITLRDSSEQVIDWQPVIDLDLTPFVTAAPDKDVWAIQFTKAFVSPMNITYKTQYLFSPDLPDSYSFEFDTGVNPQAGQEWYVDQEFQLAEHNIHLTRIMADASGFVFYFQSDDEAVESLGVNSRDAIQIEGYTSNDWGGNGGNGNWSVYLGYPELPRGRLMVTLSDLYLKGKIETWNLAWQP